MAKKKCPKCPTCLPQWLAAFGDLMSLLLCFFVLLLSMSSMDSKKVSEAIGSLSGAMSVLEGGTKTEISKKRIQESTPIESQDESTDVVNQVTQAIIDANELREKGHGPAISMEEAQEGFVIQLPASLLFAPGSAVIDNDDALLFLKRIALIVEELPNNMEISVQGHTDDLPPSSNSVYKNNWELSSARAISVLQELLLNSVQPNRINAAGFSQYRPLATNATASGREKNRRVELHFYGKKSDTEQVSRNTILDRATQQE